MAKRKFYGPKHRFAMLMNATAFDKLCSLPNREESLAAYLERMIEREYERRLLRKQALVVPHSKNYVQ